MTASRDKQRLTKTDKSLVRYQQMLEAAGDMIYTVDDAGYVTYINRRVQQMLGYTPDEMLGQHFEKYIATTWTDHARTLYDRIIRQQDTETLLELPMIHQDGSEVWVEQVVTPLCDDDEAACGLLAVTRNITGRDVTESELENRINQLATLQRVDAELTHQLDIEYVLSMALDVVMRLSLADAGAIELVKDGEIYVGKVIGDYPPDFIDDYPRPQIGIVGRVLRNRESELVLDVAADPDYKARIPATLAQMTIPLLSQDRLVGVVSLETRRQNRFTLEVFEFIQLITARIAAAVDNAQLYATTRQQLAELQELYHQVTGLEQLKTDMIRIAAHDLGNPLTAISGFTDMLLESDLSERQIEQATLVKESAMRMKKIIRNILSLQRIEEIAQGDLNEHVDLTEMTQQLFDSQKYPADLKKQAFTLEVPAMPLPVTGDAAQLREAIINLIGNALKYTPEGGNITVKLWEDNDIAFFEVVDTGYGIPKELQERLFRPFFRAKTKETRKIDGTGLGLHLVKNIIERHHGKMRVVSEYGAGSTFGFEVPLYIGD